MSTPPLRPLAFLDCETTGLSLDDDIWDFAAIIRIPGTPDVEHEFRVEHSLARADLLPESFRADHDERYDPNAALSRHMAAHHIGRLLDGAVIVGAVPSFDTTRIELLREAYSLTPAMTWHYQVIDVETLALGYARGYNDGATAHAGRSFGFDADREGYTVPVPPWDSHTLTGQFGVTAAGEHTAIGDARWARDTFDALNLWPEYARLHIDALDVVGR